MNPRRKSVLPSPAEIRYEPFPHPSDIGLTVFGATLQQLYENAAFATFDTLCNLEKVKETGKIEVRAIGDDQEGLLVNFLNELLYLQSMKGWLLRRFQVLKLNPDSIHAHAWGEIYRPEHHELWHEIKSATYHNLRIRQENGIWRVDIVLDV